MKKPVAQKIKKKITACGNTRIDNYYRFNNPDDTRVIKYLKAENAYSDAELRGVKKLQKKILAEIISRIKQNDESAPYNLKDYYYYHRFEKNKEYPVHCRKKNSLDSKEEIILDVNEIAKGHKYCNVSGLFISPDNNLSAYAVDTEGRNLFTVKIKNLITGKLLKETITCTGGNAVWANDNKTLFYTLINKKSLRPERVMAHKINTPVNGDKEIFYEEDEAFDVEVLKTKSQKYIMIASSGLTSDEYRYLDADNPDGDIKIIQQRQTGLEYSPDHFRDKFYIRTNYNALNFKIVETPVGKTDKRNWEDFVPYNPEIQIDGFEIFNKYLVLAERKNAVNMFRVIKWDNKEEHFIKFDEETYQAVIINNPDFDSEVLRINYSSLTTPDSVYDYNMKDKKMKLIKRREIAGNFDPYNYESKRLYAEASDGAKVPVSIVYRKGIKLDGDNPLLLYGYGSYGCSIDPYFSIPRLSLLDRGFIFAIAHVRGGQELGRQWYYNGKLLKKKNTFTDFISCAEKFIQLKYTSPEKLFAMGESAGGLLMGAVVNMRPDLFKGVIAAMPFVDVLTTLLDKSIPLTAGDYNEFGDPEIKKYYDYIKSYSPYDNVGKKDYPNMLVSASLNDAQVPYWEPVKWVAKLRELKTDNNLLLLHINMTAGHGGASGRFKCYKETAMQYAFMFKLLKINE